MGLAKKAALPHHSTLLQQKGGQPLNHVRRQRLHFVRLGRSATRVRLHCHHGHAAHLNCGGPCRDAYQQLSSGTQGAVSTVPKALHPPACEGATGTVAACVTPQLSGVSCCRSALRQHCAVKLTIPTANPTTMTPRKRTHVEVPNIQLLSVIPCLN